MVVINFITSMKLELSEGNKSKNRTKNPKKSESDKNKKKGRSVKVWAVSQTFSLD